MSSVDYTEKANVLLQHYIHLLIKLFNGQTASIC